MVLSATFRTVLSSTIAIRLVIRTPRMIHRRRYTFMSVSASGATAEAPARGETPGCSMVPSQVRDRPAMGAPRPVHPGTAIGRPGTAINTEQYRIAINSPRAAWLPRGPPAAGRRPAGAPGVSPARGAWHPEVVRGRHHGATRQ